MAKILSLSAGLDVASNTVDVRVLLDNGTKAVLKVDDVFITEAEFITLRDGINETVVNQIEALQAEIGALKQEIANRSDAPKPLLHEEHQDIPVGRTLAMLAPLEALSPHQPLDEPQPGVDPVDPDAPARPPLGAHRGLDEAIAEAKRDAALAEAADEHLKDPETTG